MVLEKNMDALHQDEDEEELLLDVDENQRSSSSSAIIKGKRTKRGRQTISPNFLVSSSSNYCSVSSPRSSSCSEEDELDMAANSLILLAQGIHSQEEYKSDNIINNFMGPAAPATAAGGSIDVYECKTCNRTFQSFQALGGHRASHKKPKITTTALTLLNHDHDHGHDHDHDHRKVEHEADKERVMMIITHHNTSSKIHECSICGAEFSSGQALGGHMRRHRAPQPPSVVKGQGQMINNYSNELQEHHHQNNKGKNLLDLDLNLPAPIDQEDNNKFQFLSSNMVFSSPTLVYCHY